MEILENHPETMPFVVAVGKLLQNFGMIELLSHDWIAALQTDSMVGELAKHAKLRDRIETLKKMIARAEHIEPQAKAELIALWSSTLPHAELRNIVAHNPVAMGFGSGDTTGPAQVVGVLNLKPRDKAREAELISVAEILGSVNATHSIAAKLHAALPTVSKGPPGAP